MDTLHGCKSPPSFIFGVGCQKGGTTWLYDYLRAHPSVDMGFAKEYHVFDSLYIPECRQFYFDKVERAAKLVEQLKKFNNIYKKNNKDEAIKMLGFVQDLTSYYDYFEHLFLKSRGDVRVVGDITPSYSGLPSDVYDSIRTNLISKGFSPKVVFLLRDPVERCWSAVRMTRRDKLKRYPDHVFVDSEEKMLLGYAKTKKSQIRTRYDETFSRLSDVFLKEEIFISFYETMFSEDHVHEITNFLGIPFVKPDFGVKKNVSKKAENISDDVLAEVADFYADVYKWAMESYGERFIRNIWPNAKYIKY